MATAQERAENLYDRIVEEWNGKTGDDYRVQVGQRTLIFTRLPKLIHNKQGGIIGIECWVRVLDRNGVEIKIDGHRRLVNPPLVPRSALTYDVDGSRIVPETITPAMVREALVEALSDSILSNPNSSGWKR